MGQRKTLKFCSSRPEGFYRKVLLEISQNLQENTCVRVSLLMKLQAWSLQLYQKKTMAQVFSYEFFEISKNTLL